MCNNHQIVNVSEDQVPCQKCGINLLDIANFTYAGEARQNQLFFEELCQCKNCNTLFIMHYDLFDSQGHILSRVFSEDINNPNYKWQDSLSKEQKEVISEHLKVCPLCQNRLSDEILTDAWVSDLIKELRKK